MNLTAKFPGWRFARTGFGPRFFSSGCSRSSRWRFDAHALRCAAMKLESQGYFAVRSLSSDPRWRNGSIYLFGLDTHGNPLFSGDPYSRW